MKKILNNSSVLIVDDESLIVQQMKIILEDFVKDIYTANSGSDALKILQSQHIDILLVDILMPSMTGIELIKTIRDNNMSVENIIITTAHSESSYLLDAIKLRVDGYLIKPINAFELIELIQKSILLKQKNEELWLKDKIFDAISTFVGGKKIEIIKYLFENANEENIFCGSYEDIMANLDISKPTVVSTFKQLIEVGLVTKIKNKIYKLNIKPN